MAGFYCIALILGNLYWLDARYCPGLENPTIADMQAFERASKTIGTTAKGEYLPLTVEYMPTSTGSVLVVGEAPIRVGVGGGATDTAHAFSSPKQSSSIIKGRMVRIARLRLVRRRGVVIESSIGAAF